MTDAQRAELHRRAHAPGIPPRTRDRLEMVRLSAAGWSPPKIGTHLQISEKRVRHYLKAFLAGGFDALPDRPHPGQASPFTPVIEAALRQEVLKDERTWTAEQLAAWVFEPFGVGLTPDALRRRPKRARIAWKRTSRSVKHKQRPEAVAAAKAARGAQDKRGTKATSTSLIGTRWGWPPRCRPATVGIRWGSGFRSRMKPRKGGG